MIRTAVRPSHPPSCLQLATKTDVQGKEGGNEAKTNNAEAVCHYIPIPTCQQSVAEVLPDLQGCIGRPPFYVSSWTAFFHIPHQLLTACICPSTTPLFHQRIPKPAQPLSPWLSKFCLFNMLWTTSKTTFTFQVALKNSYSRCAKTVCAVAVSLTGC